MTSGYILSDEVLDNKINKPAFPKDSSYKANKSLNGISSIFLHTSKLECLTGIDLCCLILAGTLTADIASIYLLIISLLLDEALGRMLQTILRNFIKGTLKKCVLYRYKCQN